MAGRFGRATHTARPTGVLRTVPDVTASTHEGFEGYVKNAKTELYTLALVSFGDDTFYETGSDRLTRLQVLARQVATEDDTFWLGSFVHWLRNTANMRMAAVVIAAEAAAAGHPISRRLVDAACQRADEPAEMLGYWLSTHGRKLPYAVKRGIADAARRLYTEYGFVKYDSSSANVRMGDVIELTHPKPQNEGQSALFQHAVDVRHNRDNPRGLDQLHNLREFYNWRKLVLAGDLDPLRTPLPNLATWENLSSLTEMSAAAWERVIPQMGYMALLRNLRNFEDKGVSVPVLDQVAARLKDPEQVRKSRQLPYRFWSAWKHSGTMRFGQVLEEALQISCENVPRLPGKTLVLVDTSGSMGRTVSARSQIRCVEQAGLFGAALINASAPGSVLGIYADGFATVTTARSVLRTAEAINSAVGSVGHGTATWPAAVHAWTQHGPFDRIVVFTDMQDHPSRAAPAHIPAHVPIFVWDLLGYKTANIELGSARYMLGGLSDNSFKLMELLERHKTGVWPWEYDPGHA
jgi:GNAT superfamily N-acetyltransferase